MNECDKTSIIIFVLLRFWLKENHIRKFYENELFREFLFQNRDQIITFVDIIVSCFAKFVKNNVLIFSFQLFIENRQNFHDQIFDARFNVLKLMNVADRDFRFKNNKSTNFAREIDDASATFCDETNDSMIAEYFQSSNLMIEKNAIQKHFNTFSNFHIAVHFAAMMEKYDVL